MKHARWALAGVVLLSVVPVVAQQREDRTLLNWDQMRAIIDEVSGERAQQTVLEMVPYPRVRSRAEYEGHFRESEVMARLAREYGFSNVEIEQFAEGAPLWQATRAELWLEAPERRKLCDFRDVAVSVASGSESGNVTADLVDVGYGGRPEDYAGRDVKGKIVLGWASSSELHRMAVVERGAAGVLSADPVHPEANIDQVGSQSIGGRQLQQQKVTGFGWSLSPRMARELAAMTARGSKVTLRSVIEAEQFPGRLETVHAVIPGDGSSDQQLAMSGHLYEGYLKQGANDDASGCAITLEMGRALIRLVSEGRLPRPRRTIHFLWVPEISGTMAWLKKHDDVTKKLVADLNFDMEGLGLAAHGSFWTMHRTPDSFPSFLNDVSENVMETIAAVNRERVRYRSVGYDFTLPVLSPTGSRDPFYIVVDKFYGASDHVIYMMNGVPSTMFITWPDPFYHSSHDTPDKLDTTQFKRVGVVGLGALAALATADDAMAMKVAAETLSRGAERLGQAERKGAGYIADAADAALLADAYKEAKNAVRHQADTEKAAIRSAAILFGNPADGLAKLASLEPLIDRQAAVLQDQLTTLFRMEAARVKAPAVEPPPSELEQKAARIVVEPVAGAAGFGFGGPRPSAGPSTPERDALMAATRKIPQHMSEELRAAISKRMTVLQIRDFVAGEFEPLPLADVMAYVQAQERVGLVKLVEKGPEPAGGRVAGRK